MPMPDHYALPPQHQHQHQHQHQPMDFQPQQLSHDQHDQQQQQQPLHQLAPPPPPPPPDLDMYLNLETTHQPSGPEASYSSSPSHLSGSPSSPSGSMSSSGSSVDSRSVGSHPPPPPPPPPPADELGHEAAAAGKGSPLVKTEGAGASIAVLLEEQALKRQRLARKAELARMSRKRKKERLDELEGEVGRLKAELERERKRRRQAEDDMRVALRESRGDHGHGGAQADADGLRPSAEALSSATAAETEAFDTLKRSMDGCEVPPSVVRKQVGSLLGVGVVRGSSRVGTAERVAKWVSTSEPLPAKFVAWALSRNARFYEEEDGLWRSLFSREVGVSPEQMQRLEALRAEAPPVPEVQRAAAALVEAVRAQNATSEAALKAVVNDILTPDQAARFLLWIRTYGSVCVRI